MRDLEFTLGSSTTPYLSVQVAYRHSALPDQSSGGCTTQTRLETTCTASIERHDAGSVWSPSRQRAPKQPLFEIIASHWGAEAAADVTRRMISVPRAAHPAVSTAWTLGGRSRGGYVREPPVVPRRKASLRTAFTQVAGERKGTEKEDDNERDHDRARKIWTEIRRMSSVGSGGSGDDDRKVSTGSTWTENRHSQTVVDRRREMLREKALRNRGSVGADTLRSLVPTTVDTNTLGVTNRGGENVAPERPVVAKMDSTNGKGDTMNGRSKEKENVRWSWTGWWQ